MRTSILFLATTVGIVAAQGASNATDINSCFADCVNEVDQQFPDSAVIKKCEGITDVAQELACLCESADLVAAFQKCAAQTCPTLALAQAGSAQAICARASASASLSTTGAASTAASASSSVPATPSGAGNSPASGNGAGNAPASGNGAGNAPNSGSGNDAGNNAGAPNGVALVNVLLSAAVTLAGGLFI